MRALPLLLVLILAAPAAAQQPSPDAGGAYELSQVEVLPRLRSARALAQELDRVYPPELRGAEGRVYVRFRVEPDGRTSSQTVTRSSDPAFNQPALQAVRVARFAPARVNGRAVPAWVVQPLIFGNQGKPEFSAPREGTPRRRIQTRPASEP